MASTPTIAQAVRASVEHAEQAAGLVRWPAPGTGLYHKGELIAEAMVHATLAEAYARLAGAMVVNAAAINDVAASYQPKERPDA